MSKEEYFKANTPRYRLGDLLSKLRTGEQNLIAMRVGCSDGHVSAVLNGRANQDTPLAKNIIRNAEYLVEGR